VRKRRARRAAVLPSQPPGTGEGIDRPPDDFTDAVLAAVPEPGIGDADADARKANPSPRSGSSAAKLKPASARLPGAYFDFGNEGETAPEIPLASMVKGVLTSLYTGPGYCVPFSV
jgi:hypothetical protein